MASYILYPTGVKLTENCMFQICLEFKKITVETKSLTMVLEELYWNYTMGLLNYRH